MSPKEVLFIIVSVSAFLGTVFGIIYLCSAIEQWSCRHE